MSFLVANWQGLALSAALVPGAHPAGITDLFRPESLPALLLSGFLASASLLLPRSFRRSASQLFVDLDRLHRLALRALVGLALLGPLIFERLRPLEAVFAAGTFALFALAELCSSLKERAEGRVWTAEALALAGVAYLGWFGIIPFGHGVSMYVTLGAGLFLWVMGHSAGRRPETAVLAGPFLKTGLVLPLAAAALGIHRHLSQAEPAWLGFNSLALLLAAGFYFWRGLETRRKTPFLLAAGVLNVALAMLWSELRWSDPQFYLIPLGISVLLLVEVLKREIPANLRDPLRYLGALTILVSPTFHIVEGSWLPLLTLMLASVGVVMASIGLRARALMYCGTAFLAADLAAMVVRGTMDHPSLLWMAGLTLGGAIIALAAACENHRETLLARLRGVAAELGTWQ